MHLGVHMIFLLFSANKNRTRQFS